ncbi:hypothetical protein GCM10023319_54500 [Nocardia iowensis]
MIRPGGEWYSAREETETRDGVRKMYLDLLTSASLLDHSVWASSDVWASALELSAKKKRRSSGGLIVGGICCLLVVAAIVGGIYLLRRKKKQSNQQPPNQPPYGEQPPYGQQPPPPFTP